MLTPAARKHAATPDAVAQQQAPPQTVYTQVQAVSVRITGDDGTAIYEAVQAVRIEFGGQSGADTGRQAPAPTEDLGPVMDTEALAAAEAEDAADATLAAEPDVAVTAGSAPAQGEEPVADYTSRLTILRQAMFSIEGDGIFDAAADLDGNGRVDLRDLAALRFT